MIVDFDAHQGNGHERDFMTDERVYIMDMYNRWIYPNDKDAKGTHLVEINLQWTDTFWATTTIEFIHAEINHNA